MDTFPRVSIYPHKYIYICIYSLYIYIYIKKAQGRPWRGGDHIYIIRLQVIDSENDHRRDDVHVESAGPDDGH